MADLVYLDNVEYQSNSVVTVGTFDGVHAGHRAIMDTVSSKAEERGARSVIVTFDPHPRDIINPGDEGIQLLTTLDERASILDEWGIDLMVVIPFDRDFSLLTSEEFVKDVIHQKIGVSEFVIGYDHKFGRDREGTIETIGRLGKSLSFDSYVVSKREIGVTTVSSTAIRNAIREDGNMEKASELLERPYQLEATVVHGDKRGKKIGFPTANLKVNHDKKIIPENGVYAVEAAVDGDTYRGMMNIGTRPTFDGQERTLEVNMFDFEREIYGKELTVYFYSRLRGEKDFDGVDELVDQLKNDERRSKQYFADY